MKSIEVIVTKDGSVNVETRGFAGATCLEASQFIETALGRTTASRQTPEFHQQVESLQIEQRHVS